MTSDWQPIETAPRDGTCILLCRRGYEPCAGLYFDRPGFRNGNCWLSFDPEGVFESDEELDSYMAGGRYEPTDWMPLPEPAHD